MRITVNRGGKWIIPKDKIAEASEKLARFEDAEELEDVMAYCLQLRRVADLKKIKEPELYSLLSRAADEIVNMSNFRDSAAAGLMAKNAAKKKEILDYLDELDEPHTYYPIDGIRKKIMEVL